MELVLFPRMTLPTTATRCQGLPEVRATGIVSRMSSVCSDRPIEARSARWSPRPVRGLLLGALVGGAIALSGCNDADRALTGRWVSEEPIDSTWLVGKTELTLGHFGPELTGVAWFDDDDGVASRVCPCAFVDLLSLHLGAKHFTASTDFCTGEKWLWDLTLDESVDPPVLAGRVEVKDNPGMQPIEGIRLILVDTFIPDDRKMCDR